MSMQPISGPDQHPTHSFYFLLCLPPSGRRAGKLSLFLSLSVKAPTSLFYSSSLDSLALIGFGGFALSFSKAGDLRHTPLIRVRSSVAGARVSFPFPQGTASANHLTAEALSRF